MDFFNLYPLSWAGILSAVIVGTIVGLERQIFGKPAGIRTSALICLGSYLFIALSQSVLGPKSGDATRVLGQIVSGIGFLGAGVIISKEGTIQGVTSAAVIWVLAGMGALIGFGYYSDAYFLALVILSILMGIEWLERMIKILMDRRKQDQLPSQSTLKGPELPPL